MRSLFIVLIFGFSCAGAMNMNHDPRVATGARGVAEFFASFADPAKKYFPTMFFNRELVDHVPYIGHYQNEGTKKSGATHGEFYNPRVRIALIEHASHALDRVVPASVRAALTKAGVRDLSSVEFYTNILGEFDFPDQAPFGKNTNSCNVAFHPIIRRWRGTEYANFNVPVSAGLFESNGVRAYPGGIAINSLAPLEVNYHDRISMSPDNGRFYYDPKQGIATFWTVVVCNGHANVTFNILTTNHAAESLLFGITEKGHVDGLLDVLRTSVHRLSEDGQRALSGAVAVLERACHVIVPRERVMVPTVSVKRSEPKTSVAEFTPSELAARAAQGRVEKSKAKLHRSVAGPSHAEPSSSSETLELYVDSLVKQFNTSLEYGNLTVAAKILDEIKRLDLARAEYYEDLYNQALEALFT